MEKRESIHIKLDLYKTYSQDEINDLTQKALFDARLPENYCRYDVSVGFHGTDYMNNKCTVILTFYYE